MHISDKTLTRQTVLNNLRYRDDLVGKVLAVNAWGPEYGSSAPRYKAILMQGI